MGKRMDERTNGESMTRRSFVGLLAAAPFGFLGFLFGNREPCVSEKGSLLATPRGVVEDEGRRDWWVLAYGDWGHAWYKSGRLFPWPDDALFSPGHPLDTSEEWVTRQHPGPIWPPIHRAFHAVKWDFPL